MEAAGWEVRGVSAIGRQIKEIKGGGNTESCIAVNTDIA